MSTYPKSHIISEENLISLIRNFPSQGIDILYKNYSCALSHHIFRLVNNNENTQDILQESFIKIWKNFDKYDSSKARLYTWMVKVVKNESIDFLRSAKLNNTKNRSMETLEPSSYESSYCPMYGEYIGFRSILETLDSCHQSILELLHYQGFSQSEAADHLQIPLGTVKTKARNAYTKLRKCLEPELMECA